MEVTAAVSERVSLLCIDNLRRENPSFTRSHFHPLLPSPPLRAAAAADAGCNPLPNSSGNEAFEKDSIAAYYQMVKWVATADTRYSTSAMAIIDAWAATLQGFAGHDQMLAAGICKSFLICTAHSARRARSVSFSHASHASLTTHKLNVSNVSGRSTQTTHAPCLHAHMDACVCTDACNLQMDRIWLKRRNYSRTPSRNGRVEQRQRLCFERPSILSARCFVGAHRQENQCLQNRLAIKVPTGTGTRVAWGWWRRLRSFSTTLRCFLP